MVGAVDQMEYLLRHSNTLVIGVCVNSPTSSMQSCKAARCQTNGARESTITPIYKDKGYHMNCSNYRGIKLLRHTMKLWERIIDQMLRDIVSISDGQFGFKSGVGTTDAIFDIRTLCEKYREGNKPLDMVFVDLEKAYDTVPREVLMEMHGETEHPRGVHKTGTGYVPGRYYSREVK